jgi:carboxylesterase type B
MLKAKANHRTAGPVPDGAIVPELPGLLLLHGRFDHSINVMIGHNGDEGVGYPSLANNSAFEGMFGESFLAHMRVCFGGANSSAAYINTSFPNAPSSIRQYITNELYPPLLETTGDLVQDYNPTQSKSMIVSGYNDALGRQTLFTSETVINCLTYHVNRAFKGTSYAYLFSAPPALHGQELYYVFYNGQATDVYYRPINVTLAHIMQDYWLNFARTGNPNGEGLPTFAQWGNDSNVQGLSLAGVGPTLDTSDNERCRWWQLGLYV